MPSSDTADSYRDRIEDFGEVTLVSVYRSLRRKKEHNQHRRERLREKDKEIDKKMDVVKQRLDEIRGGEGHDG